MRVDLGNIDLRGDTPPILCNEVVDIHSVIAQRSCFLAAKQYKFFFVGDSCMTLEFDFLGFASVIKFFPDEFFAIFGNIHLMEIIDDALVDVVSTVDKERVAEDNGDMVRSAIDIFAFYLEFGPSAIEGVFQLCLNH